MSSRIRCYRSELRNQQLSHELALLKCHTYGQRSEQLNGLQSGLLDDEVDAGIPMIETELEQLKTKPARPARCQFKRTPLPVELPRSEIRREPDAMPYACGCQLKRLGENSSEKLGYTPGVSRVERHIRGK